MQQEVDILSLSRPMPDSAVTAMQIYVASDLSRPMPDYVASCLICGRQEKIRLWPHRNQTGQLVGFVFGCQTCDEIISESKLMWIRTSHRSTEK